MNWHILKVIWDMVLLLMPPTAMHAVLAIIADGR